MRKKRGEGGTGVPVSGAHWGDYYPGTIEISMSSTAILLLAHGTPNRLSEMSDYLQHVTGGRPMPPHVIAELQHRYAEIGLKEEPLPEGPPLTRWTLRQAELLEDEVCTTVYVGMRNWHPFIADTVDQMKADGVTHARVLCLAPQNSRTSTGLYRRALEAAVGDSFTYDFIAGWADEPLLAQAFAEHLQPALHRSPQRLPLRARPLHSPLRPLPNDTLNERGGGCTLRPRPRRGNPELRRRYRGRPLPRRMQANGRRRRKIAWIERQ